MKAYRKANIAGEKILNYRVASPINYCCQISIIVQDRPKILVIIHSFLFQRHHSNIFELLTRMTNAGMLTSLYLFDKDLTKHLTVNIYLFNVRIVTLR